jgi:hypothetical protein
VPINPINPIQNPLLFVTEPRTHDSNNSSIEFFIIYLPSQQLQGPLQTQHSVDTGNYIVEQYNIESKVNYRKLLEEKHINGESKQINKNKDER